VEPVDISAAATEFLRTRPVQPSGPSPRGRSAGPGPFGDGGGFGGFGDGSWGASDHGGEPRARDATWSPPKAHAAASTAHGHPRVEVVTEDDEEEAAGQEESKTESFPEDGWYGMGEAAVASINDAFIALSLTQDLKAPEQLQFPGSPKYSRVLEFLMSQGSSRVDAENLIAAYATAAAEQRRDQQRREVEAQRQEDIPREEARLLAEEMARQAAINAALAKSCVCDWQRRRARLRGCAVASPLCTVLGAATGQHTSGPLAPQHPSRLAGCMLMGARRACDDACVSWWSVLVMSHD
jgi:hypothetical protein